MKRVSCETVEYEHEGHPDWVALVTYGWLPGPAGTLRWVPLAWSFGLFVPPHEQHQLHSELVRRRLGVDSEGSVSAMPEPEPDVRPTPTENGLLPWEGPSSWR